MTSKWFELGMMDSILHQNEVLNSQVPQVFGGGPPGRLSGEGPKMTGKLFLSKSGIVAKNFGCPSWSLWSMDQLSSSKRFGNSSRFLRKSPILHFKNGSG